MATPRKKKLPNIILVGIDSLRADHMSCYGYPRLTTPHLDRIASQGTLLKELTAPISQPPAGILPC